MDKPNLKPITAETNQLEQQASKLHEDIKAIHNNPFVKNMTLCVITTEDSVLTFTPIHHTPQQKK